MKYVMVDAENKVQNVIVADTAFAEAHGALPYYDGAEIGQPYAPPQVPALETRVAALEAALLAVMGS